jgi:hypothetical protein
MNADRIGIALKGRRNGNGWLVSCPCPNHGSGRGDRNPSLSVADADGKLLLRCFAGCEFEDIIDALKHRGILNDNHVERRRDALRVIPKTEPDPLALELWEMSEPIYGTVAEEYLQRRGILLTQPSLRHFRGAMIAAVHQPNGGITAIQKTPIKADFFSRKTDDEGVARNWRDPVRCCPGDHGHR